ncbi:hypothetical protein KC352_g37033, partial [Hortaea werneckii]
MAEKTRKEEKRAKKGDRVEKKSKGKKSSDKEKSQKKAAAKAAFSLLADEKSFDTGLSSLFSNPTPLQPAAQSVPEQSNLKADAEPDEDEDISEDADADLDNVALEGLKDADDDDEEDEEVDAPQPERKRKRARKDGDTEVEDAYMDRLARDEERDEQRLAAERATKRQKADAADSQQVEQEEASDEEEAETGSDEDDEGEASDQGSDDDAASPPPKHETQQQADDELAKANRTVFLGNVSTEAIASKSARRSLTQHLSSFFPAEEEVPKDTTKPKVESIRFRSTPYSSSMPKKAAYAKKELMDATTKSTNAYAVYSTAQLSREAARRLNGTV